MKRALGYLISWSLFWTGHVISRTLCNWWPENFSILARSITGSWLPAAGFRIGAVVVVLGSKGLTVTGAWTKISKGPAVSAAVPFLSPRCGARARGLVRKERTRQVNYSLPAVFFQEEKCGRTSQISIRNHSLGSGRRQPPNLPPSTRPNRSPELPQSGYGAFLGNPTADKRTLRASPDANKRGYNRTGRDGVAQENRLRPHRYPVPFFCSNSPQFGYRT